VERLTEELATLRALCAASSEENSSLRNDVELHAAQEAALRAELRAMHDLETTHMAHGAALQQQAGDPDAQSSAAAAPFKKSMFSAPKMSFKFGGASSQSTAER
jgi:hypothetical protein